MIDLHSHILPGLDDGAPNHAVAFEMARMAVADGISVMACTPHIMPGLYENTPADIRMRVSIFQEALKHQGIPLRLVVGSDAHIRPDFLACLREGRILCLHSSHYVLFEPSHIVAPRLIEDFMFELRVAGFRPILTHPERLQWIENGYDIFRRLFEQGVLLQVTAGSLTGAHGKRPRYWAQRMLSEGLVHILASDAHNTTTRPPLLSEAVQIAQQEVGDEEADNLVFGRPLKILNDESMDSMPAPYSTGQTTRTSRSFFKRIFAAA
jgi:protein-tyrosine phosphatase